jgi:hypothetical protein
VKVSRWTEQDMALIAKAKLQGLALQFVNGREELLKDTCPYVAIKRGSQKKMPDEYYCTRLQDATQDRGDTAEQFTDRCRKLCQKTVSRVDTEAAFHRLFLQLHYFTFQFHRTLQTVFQIPQ